MLEYLEVIENASPSHGTISNVGDVVAIVFNLFLGLGLSISIIGIILSGIKYMTARSDVKATIQAKESLKFSIIGFLLTVGGYTIYRIIAGIIGV